MKKKAIFPGTFDPFTIGHESMVRRSLTIVEELIISIGINDAKENYFPLEQRIQMINKLFKADPHITVQAYQNLTVDFAKEVNADFIIRGIRSVNDLEYEKTIADMNRKISGIETLILFTEPEYTHISSTIVRELLRYKHDIRNFVPADIRQDIQQKNV